MARSPLQAALPQSAARGLIQRGARLSRVVQGGLLLCAAGAIAELDMPGSPPLPVARRALKHSSMEGTCWPWPG